MEPAYLVPFCSLRSPFCDDKSIMFSRWNGIGLVWRKFSSRTAVGEVYVLVDGCVRLVRRATC